MRKECSAEGKGLQEALFGLQDSTRLKKSLYQRVQELQQIREQLAENERKIQDQKELSQLKECEEEIAVLRVRQQQLRQEAAKRAEELGGLGLSSAELQR